MPFSPNIFVKFEKIILEILSICLRHFFRICLDLRENCYSRTTS